MAVEKNENGADIGRGVDLSEFAPGWQARPRLRETAGCDEKWSRREIARAGRTRSGVRPAADPPARAAPNIPPRAASRPRRLSKSVCCSAAEGGSAPGRTPLLARQRRSARLASLHHFFITPEMTRAPTLSY